MKNVRRLGRQLAAVVAGCALLITSTAGPAAAATDQFHCYGTVNIGIPHGSTYYYVSVEMGYPDGNPNKYMLRARATAAGPWEQFLLCYDVTRGEEGSDSVNYSSTTFGEMRARTLVSQEGPWEDFDYIWGYPDVDEYIYA